jgi:1,4-dihydroxy-2-naphthoate octaprenyltransferase
MDTDAAAGKRTLAVIIGREPTQRLFALMVYGAYLAIGAFALLQLTPRGTAAALLVLPYARAPVRMVRTESRGPELIKALKLTARCHLWTGVALAVGAAVSF